jgi:serine/threonine protein kinase
MSARRIAGRYAIVDRLGLGGFGTVYRAHDEVLDRMIAVKVARPRDDDLRSFERFQREARATARLEHPHAVRIYDAGRDDQSLFLVLELVSGESLQSRLRHGPLPAAMVAAAGCQAASALAAAHALGIVHRDIKPANLLLGADGQVKVADFGVARLLGEERLTSEGGIVGTPDYMAPEQVEGGEVGPAADLFALGVVLYEMLTGDRPFGKGTTSEVLARIVRADAPSFPPGIRDREPALCQAILALLAKRPEDRPTAQQAVATLGALHPAGLATQPRSRRRGLARLALGLALVGAIVVVSRRPQSTQVNTDAPRGPGRPTSVRSQGPLVSRALTLSRLQPPVGGRADNALRDLQSVLQVGADAAEVTLTHAADGRILLAAPRDRLDHAEIALTLLDALDDHVFAEPNSFTGWVPSTRKVSFSLTGYDIRRFLYVMAAATGWSLILDDAVSGPITLQLSDVPLDVATRTLLHMMDLRSSRFGDVWIITSTKRAAEIESEDRLAFFATTPSRVGAAKLSGLLQAVSSERGIVVANARLGKVVVVDRSGLMNRHWGVVSAVEGRANVRAFGAQAVRLHWFDEGARQGFFPLIADLSGLNVVAQPGLGEGKRTAVWLHDVSWENALDAFLRVEGLAWTQQGNVLTIGKATEVEEPVVQTLRLAHEDPRFFLAFTKALSSAGTLRVDETSRTLVVRDVARRVELLTSIVKEIDQSSAR